MCSLFGFNFLFRYENSFPHKYLPSHYDNKVVFVAGNATFYIVPDISITDFTRQQDCRKGPKLVKYPSVIQEEWPENFYPEICYGVSVAVT